MFRSLACAFTRVHCNAPIELLMRDAIDTNVNGFSAVDTQKVQATYA